ncbi:MAG: hypothetical protein J6T15_05920 [Bacilli bacterium]|nr:hypothetical protein [Bacilli bacterium]
MFKKIRRDTIPCIGAFALLIIIIIIAINMSGSIKYDVGGGKFYEFTFNHLIFGNSELAYEVRSPLMKPVLSKASETCVKELVYMKVGCVPITIITVVISLLIGIGSILVTAQLMDPLKKKKILIVFASLLLICSILLFLTPILSKQLMMDTVKDLFGYVYYDEFWEVRARGSVWCGLLTLAACGLIFASPIIEEKLFYLDHIK